MYYQESSVILPKISKTIWVANSNFVIEFYEEEIDKIEIQFFQERSKCFHTYICILLLVTFLPENKNLATTIWKYLLHKHYQGQKCRVVLGQSNLNFIVEGSGVASLMDMLTTMYGRK